MAKAKEEKKLSIEEVTISLNREYGKNTIVNFDGQSEEYDVIPSGNISIDYKVLGIGGFAKKRAYMVKGWSGANKSTLSAHLAANCQAKGGTVVYIDSEHALDVHYFSALGVKFNKTFILCQPNNGEEGLDVALQYIESGEVDLVIIDSDSMLVPKSVMEAKAGTQNIGKKAKMNSDNYPKLKAAIHRNNVCLVTICQYRVDPGKMFGDNRVVPGGFAIEYIADVIVELTKRWKKEGEETLGTETDFKTTKNKTYIPFKKETFDTIFGVGIDNLQDILNLGKTYEIWKLRAGVVTYEEKKYSEEEFKELILSNPEFHKELKDKIIYNIRNNKTVAEEATEE